MKHICQFCRKKLIKTQDEYRWINYKCFECNALFRFSSSNILISGHLDFPVEEEFIYIDYYRLRTILYNKKMHVKFQIDQIFILSPREILNKLQTLSTLS